MVKGWDMATIGDFLDFKNGLNKGKEFFGYGTPIVNYTDVYKKRSLRKSDIRGLVCLTPDEIHRFDIRKNDVFFTRTSETPDEVGMTSVLLEDVDNGVFSGFVLRGRPKNDMFIPEYCKYCFSTKAVRNAIVTGCTYTTRALTNGKQLSTIEIPVPPKPEQEAITAALSDIDNLIANLEKFIAKKKAIKQGAIQELLTGKKRLPGFNSKWNLHRFGDVFTILPSNAYTRSQMAETGEVKNIHYGDLLTKYHEYIEANDDEIPYISPNIDISRFSEKCYVRSGDIIIADTAEDETVGKALEVTNVSCRMLSGQHTMLCRPQMEFAECFLGYYMNAACYHDQLIPYVTGTKVSSISKANIVHTTLYVPDIQEQTAIATILKDMDDEIAKDEETLTKFCLLRRGMMSELLTGRIRFL